MWVCSVLQIFRHLLVVYGLSNFIKPYNESQAAPAKGGGEFLQLQLYPLGLYFMMETESFHQDQFGFDIGA